MDEKIPTTGYFSLKKGISGTKKDHFAKNQFPKSRNLLGWKG